MNRATSPVEPGIAVQRVLMRKLAQESGTMSGMFEPGSLSVEVSIQPGKSPHLLGLQRHELIALDYLSQR